MIAPNRRGGGRREVARSALRATVRLAAGTMACVRIDLKALVADLDLLADETWVRIVEGDQRGLRVREDTVTDMNLLDLDIRHTGLHVHRYTQNAESISGADWEWWIGHGGEWLCLRIQAKRVDGMTYRQLDHPGERADEYQYDTLIRRSQTDGPHIHPIYVFYNGWRQGWPRSTKWNACPNGITDPTKCKHGPISRYGCMVVHADIVKLLHERGGPERRLASRFLAKGAPWSDLFRPRSTRQGREWLTELTRRLVYARKSADMSALRSKTLPSWLDDEGEAREVLTDRLPEYARRVLIAGHARLELAQSVGLPEEWERAWIGPADDPAAYRWTRNNPPPALVTVTEVPQSGLYDLRAFQLRVAVHAMASGWLRRSRFFGELRARERDRWPSPSFRSRPVEGIDGRSSGAASLARRNGRWRSTE